MHHFPLLTPDFEFLLLRAFPASFCFQWSRTAAPLKGVQGLLLLLDAVSLNGGGDGGSGLRATNDVGLGNGLVSRRGGEVGGGGSGDGGAGLLCDGRGGLLGRGGRSGGVDERGCRLLNNRGSGLLGGSGGSGGVKLERGSGVVLLDGSTGSLVGGLLADVALVHGRLLGTTHVLLGHGDVLGSGGRGGLEGLVGVLGGDLAELLSLLVGDVGGVVKLGVNHILVLDVDQGSEVEDDGGEESQAPQGSDLDEEVANESGEEGLGDVSMVYFVDFKSRSC